MISLGVMPDVSASSRSGRSNTPMTDGRAGMEAFGGGKVKDMDESLRWCRLCLRPCPGRSASPLSLSVSSSLGEPAAGTLRGMDSSLLFSEVESISGVDGSDEDRFGEWAGEEREARYCLS